MLELGNDNLIDYVNNLKNLDSITKKISKNATDLSNYSPAPGNCAYKVNFDEGLVTDQRGVKELLGYDENEFTLELILTYFHPDDIEKVQSILRKIFDYVFNNNEQNFKVLYLTCRLRKKDGSYIKVIRQTQICETNDMGNLISNISFLSDISFFDRTTQVNWAVNEDYNDLQNLKNLFKKTNGLFTKREVEILNLLVSGMTSKEIGIKLNLSYQTVDKHRKNMLHKSNCSNTAALLDYYRKSTLI